MDIVSYSETRTNLKAIMDRVVNDHVPIANIEAGINLVHVNPETMQPL